MGLFSNLRRSAGKSNFIKSASHKFRSGKQKEAVDEIYEYMENDEQFSKVLRHFTATRDDIEHIIFGIMASGAGTTARGHFVPVSAVLFPDTLAYLLRAERGQVSPAEAHFQVMDYFESGALVFQPERRFHMIN